MSLAITYKEPQCNSFTLNEHLIITKGETFTFTKVSKVIEIRESSVQNQY